MTQPCRRRALWAQTKEQAHEIPVLLTKAIERNPIDKEQENNRIEQDLSAGEQGSVHAAQKSARPPKVVKELLKCPYCEFTGQGYFFHVKWCKLKHELHVHTDSGPAGG
jgi:hypothetical protein